ncbi:hypothetical protein [Mycobacterium sp. CnD-18-1]|uniref:hypothetical protein n=1 Tax=Mycobacterium sp. CnD-18-1 TaxID=2917744 RepID=UPI001EF1D82E|nr:hypothetical protein [Mycobacterium sp. CnD-18-1]MCG7607117.1 hypothetical protein [Mycobacterium sp. CnD-18-1]
MSFEIPSAYIAQLDQRVAAIGEVLTTVVDAHRIDVANHGESAALLAFADGVAVALGNDPYYVVDLLTVAVNRLSKKAEDFDFE